jgi:YD repeat-containing protein
MTVTDPLNYTTKYTYDTFSRLASVTDKRGNLVKQITYDANGRVVEQKFAEGAFEKYEYTLSGTSVTAVKITNALGRTKSMRFNGSGQVVGTTDELGQDAEIKRDLMTNVVLEKTGPCGCPEDKRKYDARGNAIEITNQVGNTAKYEYEPVFNNLTSMTDRNGNVTTYSYDLSGNRNSMKNALNQVTTYEHDSFGQLRSTTNALNHTSIIDYDNYGNQREFIDALGNRTILEHDILGRTKSITDPLGRKRLFSFDELDRVKSITDASGATIAYDYDPNGNQKVITDALGRKWIHSYDTMNRLIATTDPLNHTVRKRNYSRV